LACKPTRQEAILIGAQRKRYRGDRRPSNLPSWPPLPSPFPPLVLRCSSGLSVSFTSVSFAHPDDWMRRACAADATTMSAVFFGGFGVRSHFGPSGPANRQVRTAHAAIVVTDSIVVLAIRAQESWNGSAIDHDFTAWAG